MSKHATPEREIEALHAELAEARAMNEMFERREDERTAQLRRLVHELARTEQRERAKLAEVLHDHLQQLIVAARMHLGMAMQAPDRPTMLARMAPAEAMLGQAIDDTRTLSVELSPSVLEESGLAGGLEWLAEWMKEKHNLDVAVVFEGTIPETDEAARQFVFQSVRELLFNVAKHSRAERAEVRVHAHGDGSVMVRVSDAGRGFNPTEAGNGRSFGLTTIRQRLHAIGGRLDVRSAPGEGTSVTVIIPASPVEPATAAAPATLAQAPFAATPATDGAARPPAAPQQPPSSRRERVRVLVVDDHPIVREGLVALLQEEENIFIVGEVSNGLDAVEEARRLKPAVVIMDVSMPGLDGVETTRRILAEQPEIRVIGLSTFDESDKAGQMREAGAVAYVAKNGPIGVIIQTVYQVASAPPARAV